MLYKHQICIIRAENSKGQVVYGTCTLIDKHFGISAAHILFDRK